ncbi:unnamed protein product [Symbiodinium necroappetens]|uniref:Uncharacterized protein n=1 Tax=Symbiodinium necroappetens TaxID=1628268 RepID=A0A812TB34_9DINO|nr:unnamed protein product [Symbiodinium necroappetens]
MATRTSATTDTEAEEPVAAAPENKQSSALVAAGPNSAYPTRMEKDDSDREGEDDEVYKKLYAKMEAKIRRMCTPSTTTGRLTAAPDLLKDWKEKGYKRIQLVKLMIEAEGDKAAFTQKVESWRKTEQFRKVVHKVKEFCEKNNFVRQNQYDVDELEYWVDFRTEGSRGSNEVDGFMESRVGDTSGSSGFAAAALDDAPMPDQAMNGPSAAGVRQDQGQGAAAVAKLMDEALTTRSKLDKLIAKMKKDNANGSDITSMEGCVEKLGTLYDDLAGIQAEVKVNGMSSGLQQQLDEKSKAVKRQCMCVLAVSCELKNKSLKRKDMEEKEKTVAAKNIVERARASKSDGDTLCDACRAIADVPDGHGESGVYKALVKTKLLVTVPWTYANIGAGPLEKHPCFRPRDFIDTLAQLNRFHCVVGTDLASAPAVLKDFWYNFKNQFSSHPIATMTDLDTEHLVPLVLHGDGGRTYKKSELMILQFQPAIGAGTSKSRASSRKRKLENDTDAAAVNLLGHSLATRFLMSVLLKKYYIEDSAPLQSLLGFISDWCGDLWENGYDYQGQIWRFLPIGLKGDLVFQAKAANLLRAFTRVRKKAKTANSKPLSGCCPWCLAGTEAIAFECFDKAAAWMQTTGARNPAPWTELPQILRAIPTSPDQPSFLKPDLFHILQMGIYKEFAASGLCLLLPHCGGTSNEENMRHMNRYLAQHCKEQKVSLHMQKLSLDLIGAKTPTTYACGGWNKGQDSVILMGFVLWLLRG